jgi:hypothetical protein
VRLLPKSTSRLVLQVIHPTISWEWVAWSLATDAETRYENLFYCFSMFLGHLVTSHLLMSENTVKSCNSFGNMVDFGSMWMFKI